MIWIIDASVAIRWFLKNESHPKAEVVLHRLIDHPAYFAVPELFCFEVYAVLSRLHPQGHDVFIKAMIPVLNGGIFRQPMTDKLANQAAFFVKKGLTGYDAAYAALAKEMNGQWLTFDEKAHNLLIKENISQLINKNLPENW